MLQLGIGRKKVAAGDSVESRSAIDLPIRVSISGERTAAQRDTSIEPTDGEKRDMPNLLLEGIANRVSEEPSAVQ